MRPLTKVLLAVLLLLLLSAVGGYFYARKKFEPPVNQLVVTKLPATCTFSWLADTSAGRITPHAALLVPVTLPGCPRTCYLQFDTGAPYSILYAKPMVALQRQYPAMRTAIQPATTSAQNVHFALGQGQVQAREMRVLPYGTAQLPDSATPFVIGTLGTDVLEGRALVLDYAHHRFTLSNVVPDSLARQAAFVPLSFKSRRLLVEAAIAGKDRQLLFDSGSSAFALLTSKSEWHKMAEPAAAVQTINVNSWGSTLTSYTTATAARLQLGGAALPLQTVTYIEGMSWWQQLLMQTSGMSGMLGNEPFAEQLVVFDVRGGRFGVVTK
ncbi:hypothetical protein MUN82_08290 [Hymenobacter aerilatus]|uniref:Aspartyl protease n=1 Tax=Hymenobacter aerilatus TaxID=2932251 RepID=A0A8T9T4R8_9BACT|nr:hypothetical protein [Hymenobacter aerilatus]UOR07086.1 hypothetical protein MUN82_08290 [Hymenobacter aerilatus]